MEEEVEEKEEVEEVVEKEQEQEEGCCRDAACKRRHALVPCRSLRPRSPGKARTRGTVRREYEGCDARQAPHGLSMRGGVRCGGVPRDDKAGMVHRRGAAGPRELAVPDDALHRKPVVLAVRAPARCGRETGEGGRGVDGESGTGGRVRRGAEWMDRAGRGFETCMPHGKAHASWQQSAPRSALNRASWRVLLVHTKSSQVVGMHCARRSPRVTVEPCPANGSSGISPIEEETVCGGEGGGGGSTSRSLTYAKASARVIPRLSSQFMVSPMG